MRKKSYHSLWQHLHKSAREKGFPLRVMFELTYHCNFSCKHCYIPESYRRDGELKTAEVFAVLDQLRDIGCFYLGFTGGEPLVRKDIMDILWYAKKLGFEIIIYTNGSLIDEPVASELARLRPNKIDITIPAMSEDICDKITGLRGSRNKVFNAINLLNEKGVGLGFKTCLLKVNQDEIDEIKEFSASVGAFHRLDSSLSPRLDGSKEPYEYGIRTLQGAGTECRGSRTLQGASLSPQAEACAYQTSQQLLFNCGVGMTQAAITPFGELKMCVMIDYPKFKLRDVCLKEAWERLKKLVAAIETEDNYRCGGCDLEPYCDWCPASSWLESRDFATCDPESRCRAEILKGSYGGKG